MLSERRYFAWCAVRQQLPLQQWPSGQHFADGVKPAPRVMAASAAMLNTTVIMRFMSILLFEINFRSDWSAMGQCCPSQIRRTRLRRYRSPAGRTAAAGTAGVSEYIAGGAREIMAGGATASGTETEFTVSSTW